ncbi:hypothetical protein HY967_02785 [Candidatus Jorgensenbacteria bacterium]|nr:hypothetical protein [Candidatus Jorgensenbacteria bacterium]
MKPVIKLRGYIAVLLLGFVIISHQTQALTPPVPTSTTIATQSIIASTKPEIHILPEEKVIVRGAKVTAVYGTTLSVSTTWGSTIVNWNVRTNQNTEFIRLSGEKAVFSEISIDDIVSFQGKLSTETSALIVNAQIVKNWSLTKTRLVLYGIVKSVQNSTFVLETEERGLVTIVITNSTKITKGEELTTAKSLEEGKQVTVRGLWDTRLKKLEAQTMKIHLPGSDRTTIEGTLAAVFSVTPPTIMRVTIGKTDYVANITEDTTIINALWKRIPLSSLLIGHTVRVYGTVNPNATIDTAVVRDITLR